MSWDNLHNIFVLRRRCNTGSQKAGDRRRRCVRQDMSAHRLQQGPVSRGLRADRVRELCGRH